MSKEVQQRLEAAGIIPVLRARSAKEAMGVVEAMVAGGITVVEVTMTVPGAIDVLRELKRSYGDKLLLGSGTVTDGAECVATIEAGAEFVVSPSLHMDVISRNQGSGQGLVAWRTHTHRGDYGMAGGGGFRQGVSLLGDGGSKLPQVAQSAVPVSAAGAHGRGLAANCSQLSGSRRLGAGCRRGPGQCLSAGGREA